VAAAARLKSILGIGEGALKCVAISSVLFSNLRRKTMKTMLLAAAAALSLGVGSAYANESGPQSGGYVYPDYQFPTHNAPSAAAAQNGQGIGTYVTNSSHGTWLFAPNQNQGNGS
jgi:hypothetical protein